MDSTASTRDEASTRPPTETGDPALVLQPAQTGIPAWIGWRPGTTPERGRGPLLVCVHGIAREARQQIERFRPLAQARGFGLLAPLFDEETYPDFQRLGRRGRGQRADLGLIEVIRQYQARADDISEKIFLAGFSGGGQFVHRFVMAYPDRVAAAAVTSAGWYTLPSPKHRYPRGLRVGGELPGVRLDPNRFLAIPQLVAVGSADSERDPNFRISQRLDAEQGRNRIERARTWTRAMNTAARKLGIANEVRCVEIPDATHSFEDCMDAGLDRLIFDFFDSVRNPS